MHALVAHDLLSVSLHRVLITDNIRTEPESKLEGKVWESNFKIAEISAGTEAKLFQGEVPLDWVLVPDFAIPCFELGVSAHMKDCNPNQHPILNYNTTLILS